MTDDNGAGLRALFYGLCSFWKIDAWTEEQTGEMPADFYLCLPGVAFNTYVVIVPGPSARQVEVSVLRQRQAKFIILDDWDLDRFRACENRRRAADQLGQWAESGDTHAARERRSLGICS